MHPCHDSRNPFYRYPTGAQPCGSTILLRLSVAGDSQPAAVRIRVWSAIETWITMKPSGITDGAWLYETSLTLPDAPCLVWYDFRVISAAAGSVALPPVNKGDHHAPAEHETAYGNAADRLGGEGSVWADLPPSYQITAYDPAFTPPGWMRTAAIYQIFPDRFRRTLPVALPDGRTLHEDWYSPPALSDISIDPEANGYKPDDFFGGTLEGIREKLPYIAGLGVSAIYLNPIFYADSSHRYDTNDYFQLDPTLGTERDFARLCSDAKDMGIRVILDGVFSHTGVNSVYFRSARINRESPFYGWYRFADWPRKYACWWDMHTLPEVDEEDPSYQEFILGVPDGVVPVWLAKGAGGWRLDVADELPMSFLRRLRSSVKQADPLAPIIGEVWEDASCKIAYGQTRSYCMGDTLDSVMNYPLRGALLEFLTGAIPSLRAAREILSLYEAYPRPFAYSLMNLMGSHDRPRALNALVGLTGEGMPRGEQAMFRLSPQQRALAIARLRLMFQIICALPGMPSIYYGDEAGLEGMNDPFCRGSYPWGAEDEELITFFRETLAYRAAHPAMTVGDVDILAPHPDVLAVVRSITQSRDVFGGSADNARITLVVNRSPEALSAPVSGQSVTLAPLSWSIIDI